MIKSEDISVVVQGAIDKQVTKKCLQSIRKNLPQAEIILSTWENSDVSEIEGLFDCLVLNKDPGAVNFSCSHNKLNNINRMILSTKNGIKKSKCKYVLKLRSDMYVKSDKFLKFYIENEKRIEDYKVFKHRILCYPYFSLKFHKVKHIKQNQPFHISDWCYFGLKEDLLNLYDVNLVKEPDFSQYFIYNTTKENYIDIFPDTKWQYPPEQYITLSCMKKYYPQIVMKHRLDITKENIKQSEICIVNNFKIIDINMWGIVNKKKNYSTWKLTNDIVIQEGLYSYAQYLLDYKKYIDQQIVIPKNILIKDKIFKNHNFIKYKFHQKKLLQGFLELVIVIYYIFNTIFDIVRIIYEGIKNNDTK